MIIEESNESEPLIKQRNTISCIPKPGIGVFPGTTIAGDLLTGYGVTVVEVARLQ